ncbi:MAG: cytochrome c oxidase assembly protein [Actinomycetes bacterium]
MLPLDSAILPLAAEQVGPDAGSPLAGAVAVLYLLVYAVRWRSTRRDPAARSPGWSRLLAFAAGCALLGLSLGPPLDSLAEQSATMHMIQHVILLDLVPILLLAGLTKALLRPVTKRVHGIEERMGLFATPAFAVVLYCGLMFAWHVPTLYDAALRNSLIHTIEHASLLTAGLLYWWHLMGPVRQRLRFGGTGPVLYMASTKAIVAMLGIILIFSPTSLYAYRGDFLGMDPLTDQRVAGLVMATEQTLVMGIAFAVLFMKMLSDSERRQRRAEAIADSKVGAEDADRESLPS